MNLSIAVRAGFVACATVLCAVAAAPVAAVPVSLIGGFTGYSGVVGFGDVRLVGSGIETYVNGQLVRPSSALPSNGSPWTNADFVPGAAGAPGSGVGYGSASFATPSQRVVFYETQSAPGGAGPATNQIVFTPNRFIDLNAVGEEFLLGTFTYTNGDFWSGVNYQNHLFNFTLTTLSADTRFNGSIFDGVIALTITRGLGGTPSQNADFFFFENRKDLGSVRVFERQNGANTGTVNLFARIGSLIPTRFDDATGGAFLNSSVVPELAEIPEPGTLTLLALGLSLVGILRQRGRARI